MAVMGGYPGLLMAGVKAVVARAAAGVLGAECPAMEVAEAPASVPPATGNGFQLHFLPS